MSTYHYRWVGPQESREFHRVWKAICALSSCPMSNANKTAKATATLTFAKNMVVRASENRVAQGLARRGTSKVVLAHLSEVVKAFSKVK